MFLLIIQSICISTFITNIIAVSLKNETEPKTQPDIEDFINRLLESDKFQKIAEKIAEKAADRIISLQKETSHNDNKSANVQSGEPPTPRSITSQESKKDETKKHVLSDEKSDEIISNKNETDDNEKQNTDESQQNNLNKKSKIDTLAAMHKFSKFPSLDLSLNFKHFTTQENQEFTPSATLLDTTKSERHHKSTHKKKQHKKIYKKNNKHKKHVTEKSEKEKLKNKSEPQDSVLSIDERQESGEEKKRKNFHDSTKNKKILTKNNDAKELDKETSESSSSQSGESSSTSNESKSSLPIVRTKENKTKKRAESNEKTESETNELNMPDFLSQATLSTINQKPKAAKSKATSPSKHAEKSSQESESAEKKVENIVDSAKLNGKQNHKMDAKVLENIVSKENEKDNVNKINLKHKVREQNGKFYAFAESSDYDEYHEQLSKILQSVKDKNSDSNRKMINKDLLDFIAK